SQFILARLVGSFVLRQNVEDLLDHTSASDNFKGRDSMPYTFPYFHTATCCGRYLMPTMSTFCRGRPDGKKREERRLLGEAMHPLTAPAQAATTGRYCLRRSPFSHQPTGGRG